MMRAIRRSFVLYWKKMCMKLEDLPSGARIFVDAHSDLPLFWISLELSISPTV